MKILLVRHGESTGNRDHLWAGITDHELTMHGFEQAKRLALYLRKVYAPENTELLKIYSSDLIRARRTAQHIADAFEGAVVPVAFLREQDLGWREGLSIKNGDRSSPANAEKLKSRPGESKHEMDIRARHFIEKYLEPLLASRTDHAADKSGALLIVVSHGLFLLRLYYALTLQLKIALPPTPMWSNTGCTTLWLRQDGTASVTDLNSTDHLRGLKRTRGVGSSQYDTKQQKVSDFFGAKRNKSIDSQEEKINAQRDTVDTDADIETQVKAIDFACAQVDK